MDPVNILNFRVWHRVRAKDRGFAFSHGVGRLSILRAAVGGL